MMLQTDLPEVFADVAGLEVELNGVLVKSLQQSTPFFVPYCTLSD